MFQPSADLNFLAITSKNVHPIQNISCNHSFLQHPTKLFSMSKQVCTPSPLLLKRKEKNWTKYGEQNKQYRKALHATFIQNHKHSTQWDSSGTFDSPKETFSYDFFFFFLFNNSSAHWVSAFRVYLHSRNRFIVSPGRIKDEEKKNLEIRVSFLLIFSSPKPLCLLT